MPPGADPQRLAAIVAIDIVGYSSLSERDAGEAVARVARLRERATAVAAQHQGRIFNTAGDGVMLEFPTATAALSAAMVLCADEQDTPLRFGVHLGEVTGAENGDLLGHGVNVAARLQSEAAPGAILASQSVRDSAEPELAARLTARGKIRLSKMRATMSVFAYDPKGVAARRGRRPRRCWRCWRSTRRRATAPRARWPTGCRKRSSTPSRAWRG